ncbi:MAG: hypothetical protein DRP69_06340, partial [Candidatus Duberdicusella sinuisediminis]
FFSLFLNLSAQGKIKVYDLGRVKEGEIVNEEIPLERKPQSIISGCECLKVSFKEGKSVLQVNLDTSGYKGESEVFLYLTFEDFSVIKIIFSFKTI